MSNKSDTRLYIQILLWMLYLILFPFQFFPPGSPQLADLSILIGITSFVLSKWTIDNYIKNLSYFVFYSILIGIFYSLIYYDIEFLKQPLNYVYCLASLLFVSQIANHPKFISLTIYAIFISLLIQLYVFKTIGINEEKIRFILYFNNPNQLGLWALSLLVFISFLILFYKKNTISILLLTTSLMLCIFYIILSISQAAIISAVLILLILFLNFLRSKWLYFLLPLVLLIFGLLDKELQNSEYNILVNVQNRIENEATEDDGDNNLEGRNYTRIFKYPGFIFFGAGEGKVDRFGKNGLEIHSTYANVLFSYGLLGIILFFLPILNFIKRKPLILTIILGAYLVFTLVHNTIRWPLFWIVPYLLYLIPSFQKINEKE